MLSPNTMSSTHRSKCWTFTLGKMIISWPACVKYARYNPETQHGFIEFETTPTARVFTKPPLTEMIDVKPAAPKERSKDTGQCYVTLVDKRLSYDVNACVEKLSRAEIDEIFDRPIIGLFETIPECFESIRVPSEIHPAKPTGRIVVSNEDKRPPTIAPPSIAMCVEVMLILLDREKKNWKVNCAIRDICRIAIAGEPVQVSKWTPTYSAILPDVDEDDIDEDGATFDPAGYFCYF